MSVWFWNVMLMFQFTTNDFLACNGTRQGATHLHQRMGVLCDVLVPHLKHLSVDLVAVVSPVYTTSDFQPNRNRPRDHGCLYFVDRKLKKSAFPRLPQLGVYVHQNTLAIGFYSGWWSQEAMQMAIADRKVFRGLVPRKGYRCLAGDVIVASPDKSVAWSPAKLDGVDRSLFVGKVLDVDAALDEMVVDVMVGVMTDLYPLYCHFTEKRREKPEPDVVYDEVSAEPSLVRDALAPEEAELVVMLYRFLNLQGFHIAPDMLYNVYLCLKTKPFMMLAGISGTGKSTVIRLIAEAINGTDAGRALGYRLIPVRPDWHDVRDLLGFENLLTGVFRPGALLEAMLAAQAEPNRPYFVCLDEMNLARVEHYFADFLSILETARRVPDGGWTTDQVVLAQGRERIDTEGLGEIVSRMPIPSNLFVVGTVNMDETTYAFSPKVLDRANTVAFDEVDLSIVDAASDVQIDSGQLQGLGLALCDRPYRQLDDIRHREEVMVWNVQIEGMNAILQKEGLHFAYRIRDEILRYMAYALDLIESLPSDAPLFTVQDAFDYQILQKVLPRLTGVGDEAGEVLEELIGFCEGEYVRSARKLGWMKRRLERTGFVSFW